MVALQIVRATDEPVLAVTGALPHETSTGSTRRVVSGNRQPLVRPLSPDTGPRPVREPWGTSHVDPIAIRDIGWTLWQVTPFYCPGWV
jgi:hypothetical protein